jgi:hypothetical protein
MDNKAGGAPPNGSPDGEPIANTWFTSVDRCAGPLGVEGSSQLGLYNLPASEYELKLYHNLWEPASDSSRECTRDGYGGRGPTDVHVRSLAGQWAWWNDELCRESADACGPARDALNKTTGVASAVGCHGGEGAPGVDCPVNVIALQEAFGIQPTSTKIDADVATSTVRFWTDGSPVIIHSQTGEGRDSQYRGDRAAVNAFELLSVPPQAAAECKGDASGDGNVNTDDLNLLVVHLFNNGTGEKFEAPVGPYPLADINDDGVLDTDDLNVLAVHLFNNGSGEKFDAPCM